MTSAQGHLLAYDPPASALQVIDVLERAGYEAWIVGGWVRDALRGDPSHDVDIMCSALWPDTTAALRAAGFEVWKTGTQQGTVTAWVDGQPIEVTTYRVDGDYSDHRHPDTVRFVSDPREDLARRDLTINAMAYHPVRGLLDPFGGEDDLAAGIIRTVGDPRVRFSEDALRVFRAVRFACRMGFAVEEKTQQALEQAAPDLEMVSQERRGKELDGIVATGRVGWALMHETDVMCAAIPEIAAMRGFDQRSIWHAYDVLEHTAHVCNAVEAFTAGVPSHALRWAALLHDVGKPISCTIDDKGRGHFYGHPVVGESMARQIMKRLGLPGDLIRSACALVRHHDHIIRPTARSMRRTLALLHEFDPGNALPLSHALMDLKRADAVSKQPMCAAHAIELDQMDRLLNEEQQKGLVLKVSDLAIGGREVIEMTGTEPGPMVGMTLSELLRAVVDGEVENTRDALMGELFRIALENS